MGIGVVVVALCGLAVYGFLARPSANDRLVDTVWIESGGDIEGLHVIYLANGREFAGGTDVDGIPVISPVATWRVDDGQLVEQYAPAMRYAYSSLADISNRPERVSSLSFSAAKMEQSVTVPEDADLVAVGTVRVFTLVEDDDAAEFLEMARDGSWDQYFRE